MLDSEDSSQMHRFFLFPLALLTLIGTGWAQAPNPASDAQAITLATGAVRAMTGGATLQDATLTGTAVWVSGPNTETGTATLKSRGFWQSRLDLSLSNGPWSEVRDSSNGAPSGTWTGADNIQHASAEHNCWTDPNWFFPPLSSLVDALADPTIVLSYVGAEAHEGMNVQHVRATRYFPQLDATSLSLTRKLSAVDFYLDAYSYVPDAVGFNAHPDNNENTNIPVEIRFANYQAINGVLVPMRIQKVFNGNLLLDVTVTSAQFNTGLPATAF